MELKGKFCPIIKGTCKGDKCVAYEDKGITISEPICMLLIKQI